MGAGKTNSSRNNAKSNSILLLGQSKLGRVNRNNQLKKTKRENSWLQKRSGAVTDSSSSIPTKVIGIFQLSDVVDVESTLEECFRQLNDQVKTPVASTVFHTYDRVDKTQFTFIIPPIHLRRDLFFALELAKAVDIIIFPVHSNQTVGMPIIDEIGLNTLSALKAVGCPDALFCVDYAASLDELGQPTRLMHPTRASRKTVHQDILDVALLPGARVVDIYNSVTGRDTALVRILRTMTPKAVNWRAQRSYLLADISNVFVEPQQESEDLCKVRVGGYLRGRPMQLNSLVHLVGAGAGRVVKVWRGQSPCSSNGRTESMRVDAESCALLADKERAGALRLEASGDSLMGEQTWPTEDELMMKGDSESVGLGDNNARKVNRPFSVEQLPEGMSLYQADWFMDEEGQLDFVSKEDGLGSVMGDDEDFIEDGGESKAVRERQKMDEEFPDEMDTPDNISARQRFARYRALQSFRASPWHPKENLPQDYSRIFQFENFGGTQRRLLAKSKNAELQQLQTALQARKVSREDNILSGNKNIESNDHKDGEEVDFSGCSSGRVAVVPGVEDFIQTGQYVWIEIEDVPSLVCDRLQEYGFLLCYSLYEHEQKLSVLHFQVAKFGSFEEPIKSKDELLFLTGFRSFLAKPIFSESNLNCDKHKFERFLLPGRFSMASCYGPIMMSNSPLLVFKRMAGSCKTGEFRGSCGFRWSLVATGNLVNVEPDRIMLKKIILTGFPIRVRKNFAVVRHMFHEPQDVRWFKPAELVTKWGLRGHITEPVGTHGLLKALFNGPIKQNDTVMLILYKRVFPKFPDHGLELQ
eukprot:CAMPEP_0170376684 /NCGR_PEP_ID=MMETSP0117_2-20130122/11856_1 /TAXON_ID=400756 /ORGANISM="Durinskia baltica, Strain CSIRO CS-38" /LENGTH=810 /DNA_ID=CAMNT_0010631903 /DNA_START=135 /DNA_END=2567 /DNA_ORIENTATION=-